MILNTFNRAERPQPVAASLQSNASLPEHISERKVYHFVPIDRVGELVQSCFDAGMKKVVVTANKGGGSCTFIVES